MKGGPGESRLPIIFALSGLLVAALTLFTTLRILYICYNPLPWGDMWDYWVWFRSHEHDWVWHLAAQYNEHRLLIPRLFFLFDQFSTGGTQLSLAIFIPLIQLAHAVALWRLAAMVPGLARPTVWFLGAIALAAMFASQQFTNFTWYFQIQFVLVYFGATLSLLALMKAAADRTGRKWPAITVALALATTYSMANGLLIWPLLVSMAFFLALSRRIRLGLFACGVCSFVVYLFGYVRPPKHPSPLDALHHFGAFARFLVIVIGSPFADVIAAFTRGFNVEFVQGAAAVVGSAGLAAALLVVINWLFKRPEKAPAELVYVHVLLFDLGSMALIAAGRFTFPVKEALTSRYTTPALLFWLMTVSLLVIASARSVRRTMRAVGHGLQIALLVAFVLFVALDQPAKTAYAKGYQVYLSEAGQAVSNNVFDEPMWLRAGHPIPVVFSIADYLRAKNLSIFHEPWRLWLGQAIDSHFRVSDSGSCKGSIDRVAAIEAGDRSGYRVEGWDWDSRSEKIPHRLLFTDGAGRIIGSGVSGSPRPDVAAALHNEKSSETGWVGYVSGLNHDRIVVYAQLPSSRGVCPVASHETTPKPK